MGISLCAFESFSQTTFSDTIQYTGAEHQYTIPACASNIVITTYGAQGAHGSTINPSINSGGLAGLGNRVSGAWNSLQPGSTIFIYVGGAATGALGGFNGGGNGQASNNLHPSGGGGGATDIRYPSNALSDRIQVAGGGGGGGNAAYHWNDSPFIGGNGGNGGGSGTSLDGSNGEDVLGDLSEIYPGGQGGTSSAPGAPGIGCASFSGQAGGMNSGAVGGAGGIGSSLANNNFRANGGAGGGGYIGGKGGGGGTAGLTTCMGNNIGAGGGGSAGTNYLNGSEPTDFENGVRQGNGMVVIQYTIVAEEIELSLTTTPCIGQEAVLNFSPEGGTFSVIQGNEADLSQQGLFSPSALGVYQIVYTYLSACTNEILSDTLTVNVACNVAGIEEAHTTEFNIYPNPASETLFVQAMQQIGDVSIIDLQGKIVMSSFGESTIHELDVRNLDSGVYFLQTNLGTLKFMIP